MLLVDTNIWLAAGDRRSRRHGDCAALLAAHAGELAAPVPVIAETAWLLLDRGGPDAQAGFVATITTGRLEVLDLTAGDWARVFELVEIYADLALDVIDASIVAVVSGWSAQLWRCGDAHPRSSNRQGRRHDVPVTRTPATR